MSHGKPVVPLSVAEMLEPPGDGVGQTFKVMLGEQSLCLTTNENPDGSLGSIFIDMPSADRELRFMLTCFAIAVNIALQHGTPLLPLVQAYVQVGTGAELPVAGDADISVSRSPIDYVFRRLGVTYCQNPEFAHHWW